MHTAQSTLNHHCLSTVLLNVAFKSKVFLSFCSYNIVSAVHVCYYIYEQHGCVVRQNRDGTTRTDDCHGLRWAQAGDASVQPPLFCEKDPLMCNARWCLNPRANFRSVTQGPYLVEYKIEICF